MQRINSTFIDLSDISGTFSFANAMAFLANAPSRFRQNFQAESTQRNTYLGFFFQDEWHLRPNLTFSVGLRWEEETIVRDLNNFGPRLAVAYDPFKSGKTVIRLGAGIFYNRALLRTIDDFTLGTQQLFFDTNDLIDPATGLPVEGTPKLGIDPTTGVPIAALPDGEPRGSEAERTRQWREIGLGAQILRDLGVSSIRLLSSQERTYVGLSGFGIEIVRTEPLDG